MDPVVGSIIVAIVSGSLGGVALIRTSRVQARATESAGVAQATKILVDGLQKNVDRLDAQLAARESIIEDLREDLDKCHSERRELAARVDLLTTRMEDVERDRPA